MSGALAGLPANASQARSTANPSASLAKIKCDTQVAGVNNGRKLVIRTVSNTDLVSNKVTSKRLPLDPTGMAFYGSKAIRGGFKVSFTAISGRGRPQIVSVKQLNRKPKLTFTSERMLNKSFKAQLYAGSDGFYVFTASSAGMIKRWTTYRNARGGISFGDPQNVLQGLRGIRTLAFADRARVKGIQYDVLYATHKHGGILQVMVPTGDRGRTRVKTITTEGFRGTTSMSLSRCGNASTLSILAIDAVDNEATWFTLTDQFHARARNLTNRGLVAETSDWRLHATL